jgi:hypothetical protein
MEGSKNWFEFVNGSESECELDDLRLSAQRGRPFGSEDWVMKPPKQFGLELAMNARGRPKRTSKDLRPLFVPWPWREVIASRGRGPTLNFT